MDRCWYTHVLLLALLSAMVEVITCYNCYRNTSKSSKPAHLSSHSSVTNGNLHHRLKRQTLDNEHHIAEFESGDYLQLEELGTHVLSTDEFTISLWIYLEGGQPDNARILSLDNNCLKYSPWTLAIKSASEQITSTRVAFILEDVYQQRKVISADDYRMNRWFHLAVVNNVHQLRMYMDGVRVATIEGMLWKEYLEIDCLTLKLGDAGAGFRGKLREVRVMNTAYTARMVKQIQSDIYLSAASWLYETFDNSLSQWRSRSMPKKTSVLVERNDEISITAPPCGKTVCDNPEVVMHYASNYQMTKQKVVKLEVIYTADDDGTNPSVTPESLEIQKQFIMRAFAPSNITWNLSTRVIQNTTLNSAHIMIDCQTDMVGNRKCDSGLDGRPSCNFEVTNFDGGDCTQPTYQCYTDMIGNGHCDSECNDVYNDFDGGDCCVKRGDLCVDPLSPNRIYFHLSEIKDSFQVSNDKINLVLLNWIDKSMLGIAAMPWEHNSDSMFGTVIVAVSDFIRKDVSDTIVHELGHVLGLWHVHHGISEMTCTDECLEKWGSLELGDLCADTSPSAIHTTCSDPNPDTNVCSIREALIDTPYDNFMSYAAGPCVHSKSFTKQQMARMHCYLDLVHLRSVEGRQTPPLPLPLKVTSADSNSVTLAWLPPMSTAQQFEQCSACSSDGSFTQYAVEAYMTGVDTLMASAEKFYPESQATGPPDAAKCQKSHEVWIPTIFYNKLYKCKGPCLFVFMFAQPVIPRSIRLWIPWFASQDQASPVTKLELRTHDSQLVKEIDKIHIQCDIPFAKTLEVDTPIQMVVMYTNTPDIAIDAIELTSPPEVEICSRCSQLKYKMSRSPSFPGGDKLLEYTTFEDKDVDIGETYTYTITPMLGDDLGHSSVPFVYEHSLAHCGNRKLENDEECDDGNRFSQDGCSADCKIERGYDCIAPDDCRVYGLLAFLCPGTPSVCWKGHNSNDKHCNSRFTHDPDGCGHHVPEGYLDQWASSVNLIGRHLQCSSSELLIGPPHLGQQCHTKYSDMVQVSWLPCQLTYPVENDHYILKFGFDTPVVAASVIIHLAVDGSSNLKSTSSGISAFLIYEDGDQKDLGMIWQVSCYKSPLIIPVYQDLSLKFKRTKEVLLRISNRLISIAAIRLRTFESFDPVTIDACDSQLYNIGTRQCLALSEKSKDCPPLDVKNGNFTCTGKTCSVFCEHGYRPNVISGDTTCADGKWTPQISCELISCDRPKVPMGFASCPDGHHFGSICRIGCNPPSTLLGNSTLIKCSEYGTWTQSRSTCTTVCPDLQLNNAEVLDQSCIGPQAPGSRCRINCLDGYHVGAYDAKVKKAKPVCMPDGTWDVSCARTVCPSIPAVWAGLYKCTDGENSKSVCTATCPGTQKQSKVTCNSLGEWDENFDVCDLRMVTCPAVDRPDLILECQGDTAGSKCRVSCTDTSLTIHEQSVAGSKVVVKQFRNKLQCNSLGEWFPPLDSLMCTPSCNENYIGDGWCDASNNRAMCRWDGGDCCKSTSKAHIVQPFPDTCTEECTCKDPAASENDSAALVRRRWKFGNYAVDHRNY